MQLMPPTARRFGVGDAFDANQNIRGGVQYLAWLLKRFNGNLTLAAAGYNAGEGAVARYSGVPPYSETRPLRGAGRLAGRSLPRPGQPGCACHHGRIVGPLSVPLHFPVFCGSPGCASASPGAAAVVSAYFSECGMTNEEVNTGRRRFLTATTAVVGAVGAGFAAVPFIKSWSPSARARFAGAPVTQDIGALAEGQQTGHQLARPADLHRTPLARRCSTC